MDTQVYSEILKNYAVKCIDRLSEFKEDLYENMKEEGCFDKKSECLSKINIFEQGSEILKNVFNLEEHEKNK
jgi:hypothetical protein